MVNAALKTPENHGNYHDYIELCKLYDKNENGTMMLAELENILSNLADEIPKEDTLALLAELADPEDEDFLPIHSIHRPIVRKGLIWLKTKITSLRKRKSENKNQSKLSNQQNVIPQGLTKFLFSIWQTFQKIEA